MRSIHFAMMGAAVTLATACASQPEPEPTPAPTAPVTEARPAPTPPPTPPRPTGPTAGSSADFLSKVTDRVCFDYDQHTLDDADRASLQAQAAWLKQYPSVAVQIAGNADERGTREYNLALGARRAESVSSYLGSLGVDASRISTISYGKDRPIDPGNNEAAWAKNRNSHTIIVSGAVS
jgi:peptidoglycan-associated lipoprotein